MGKKSYDISEIITAVRESKASQQKVIRMLYSDEKLRSSIQKFVYKKGGNDEDAIEIFHSTLIQFVKTVSNKEDFQLKTSLEQYLFGIARNLWFQKLAAKTKNKTEDLEKVKEGSDLNTPEKILITEEKKAILHEIMDKMGETCKSVLMLWANGYNMQEIADQMEYSSAGGARKKKCNCLKKLTEYLRDNPDKANQLK